MTLWVLFGLCIVLECIFTPWYLKALWPNKCFKSLVLKMICSTLFVSVAVLSMLISNNTSEYAITMLVGAVFGWIGDYFLHAKSSHTYFAIGFVNFMIGHIVYIVAYIRALPHLFPDYKMFNIHEILILLILFSIGLIGSKITEVKLSPFYLKFGVILYTLILMGMVIKASALGYNYYLSGGENGVVCAFVLIVGSVSFMLSDATLAIILFGKGKKNYPLKIFNILTYFAGQVMLASSILFIKA